NQLFDELIVDLLIQNQAGTRRALLALESESGLDCAFYCSVDVSVGFHDHCVFAAHLKDGALNPDLSFGLCRGGLVDVQAKLARSGEGDVAALRMSHQRVAKGTATARGEVHDARWHPTLFEDGEEETCNRRGITRRLEDHGISADDGRHGHAGHDGAWEV